MAKILWVHTEDLYPINGLCEYGGNKCWFRRVDKQYNIIKLTQETITMLEDNRTKWAETTCSRRGYEDPIPPFKLEMVNKDTRSNFTDFKIHRHSFSENAINGEVLDTLSIDDFSNIRK